MGNILSIQTFCVSIKIKDTGYIPFYLRNITPHTSDIF